MMKRPGLKIALGLCLLLAAAVFGAVSAGQLLGGVVNIEKNDFTSNELAPTQQQDVAYPIAQAACPMRLDPSEIEGETLFCGTVTVPQNYEEPDGKQIELAFALLKSTSLSPATDPVIYLHGGPGAAELRSLAELSERLASLRQTRDIVVFDQRGTGYSNEPVACDVEYVTQQDEVRDLISSYAQNASINEEFAVNMAMFKLCLDRLEDSDVDLTQYNTFNNARDVTSVAAALKSKSLRQERTGAGDGVAGLSGEGEPTGSVERHQLLGPLGDVIIGLDALEGEPERRPGGVQARLGDLR